MRLTVAVTGAGSGNTARPAPMTVTVRDYTPALCTKARAQQVKLLRSVSVFSMVSS